MPDDPAARAEVRPLLKRLNLNLWLRFVGAKKGQRDVRVLEAGLITTGTIHTRSAPTGTTDCYLAMTVAAATVARCPCPPA